MSLWGKFWNWLAGPVPTERPRALQAGGVLNQAEIRFTTRETVLLKTDVTGTGGKLLLQAGIEVAYRVGQGPHAVKIRLYRDGQMLAESLPHHVNSFCPVVTITMAGADPIGIGRYTYSLRAVVQDGEQAYACHPWLIWVEGRA